MRDRNEFRERFKRWKETGESQYENGLIKRLESNLHDDPPVESGIPYPMLTSSDYDDARAWELGFFKEAGAKGHLWSRDDETGRFLKTPVHPTVGHAIWGDMREGYDVYQRGGQYYSQPNFSKQNTDRLNPNIRPPMLPGYAEGKPGDPPTPITTGGAGYIPDAKKHNAWDAITKEVFDWATGGLPTDVVRQRLYDNLNPYNYTNALYRVHDAIVNNNMDPNIVKLGYRERDALWAKYLLIPEDKRHTVGDRYKGYYQPLPADYKPTNSQDENATYYKLTMPHTAWRAVYKQVYGIDPLGMGDSKTVERTLGPLAKHTVSRGRDERGEYMSYYDKWDLTPYGLDGTADQTRGIGKPFELYDRMYLDDYFNIPLEYRGASYLPEVIVKPRK